MLANIAWMFVEGLFLHSRVTIAIFNVNPPFKAYYFIGWGKQLYRLQVASDTP